MFGKKNKKKKDKKEYTAEDVYKLCGVKKEEIRQKTVELNTYIVSEFVKQSKDDAYSIHEYKANMVKEIASKFTKSELAFMTYFLSVANTMQKLGGSSGVPIDMQQQTSSKKNNEDNKDMYQ